MPSTHRSEPRQPGSHHAAAPTDLACAGAPGRARGGFALKDAVELDVVDERSIDGAFQSPPTLPACRSAHQAPLAWCPIRRLRPHWYARAAQTPFRRWQAHHHEDADHRGDAEHPDRRDRHERAAPERRARARRLRPPRLPRGHQPAPSDAPHGARYPHRATPTSAWTPCVAPPAGPSARSRAAKARPSA